MEILAGIILGVVGVIFFLIYNTFMWGFVTFKFYEWFILTHFDNMPPINYIQFVCIVLFLEVLIHPSDSKENEKLAHLIISKLIYPWIVLLIGMLFKLILN